MTATLPKQPRFRSEAEVFNELFDLSPLGFEAGDTNLYRYVGNSPTNATDPTGLIEKAYQGCPIKVLVYDADDQIAGDFASIASNLMRSGKVDTVIPTRHSMSKAEIMNRIKETVRQQEGKIELLWFLDHGSTSGLGQYIGKYPEHILQPEDFAPLGRNFYPRLFTDNAEIRLDGCKVGMASLANYRQRIADITGAKVIASPDFQRIDPYHMGLTPVGPNPTLNTTYPSDQKRPPVTQPYAP